MCAQPRTWPWCERLLPPALAIAVALMTSGEADARLVRLLNRARSTCSGLIQAPAPSTRRHERAHPDSESSAPNMPTRSVNRPAPPPEASRGTSQGHVLFARATSRAGATT
jgi:hypothetical protein